jgi:C4-dicarboxylate-binding protein DctP
VKVEVHPNGSLFGDAKEMEALLLGDVQMLAPSLSKFTKFTRRLQVFDLPFLFDDMGAVDRFQNSVSGHALLRSMASKNLTGLGYWHNGLKQLSANRPLLAPADAQGLKFRIQPSQLLAAEFEALGAATQTLPFNEVYAALQSGAVDGQENTWSNIYSQRYHEVQKHFTETNHGVIDYMVLVNARWWNRLPRDVRDGLQKAVDAATRTNNEIAGKLNADAKRKIIASGVTSIHELDAKQRAAWRTAMAPVWRKFEGEIGRRLIDAARRANGPAGN